MSEIETLGLLDEIQALVSDQLQVVSYKWLSRNYLLPSNVAKRLLQQFVEKHESGLDIVYSLYGRLKENPSSYHVQLVLGHGLAEAKEKFDGSCSVQVYSVQACMPKDPAAIWNAEFLQTEELFRNAPGVDNCLRDNRFGGVSNSFVKRNVEGTAGSTAAAQPKSAGTPGSFKSNLGHENEAFPTAQLKKLQQYSPIVGQQHHTEVKDVKKENNSSEATGRITNEKKGQNSKSFSGGAGSLANIWGRATVKSKPSCTPAENDKSSNQNVSAESQIHASEEADIANSDDDGQNVNFKRAANNLGGGRKRRVVLDYSDEEDDYAAAITLASPDPPKEKSGTDSSHSMKALSVEKNAVCFDEQKEGETKVKEEKSTDRETHRQPQENLSVPNGGKNAKASPSVKIHSSDLEKDASKKACVTDATPSSPKRRKVLKTQIDERGREVSEVVWEGEETEIKKDECNSTKMTDNKASTNTVNRPPVAKKSPAIGNIAPSNATGRGKKPASKDPKQGNILSFFKRV